MPRKRRNVPYSEACRLVGGEDELKKLEDPSTGERLYSEDWRSKRSKWYMYRTRGVPAHILLDFMVKKVEKLESQLRETAAAGTQVPLADMTHEQRMVLLAQLNEILRLALED